MVPMRDGVRLRADVYRPDRDPPVPAILNRTCYDRSFALTPSAALDPDLAVEAGLALVCQDVRGQFSSDGDFYPLSDRSAGRLTTRCEWVADRPWCNGAVTMAGRSYSGATQWLAAAERPTSLVAICPVATGSNYHDGWIYQGGAFQLGFNLFWTQMMTAPRTTLVARRAVSPSADRRPAAAAVATKPRASTATGWRTPPTTSTGRRSRSTASTIGSTFRRSTSAAGTTCC